MKEFPETYGFSYNEDLDEWEKTTFDGKIIIWKVINSSSQYQISFVDEEDYLHPFLKGDEQQVIECLKSFERDKKLSELLND
jgi:hypothetical protein